MNKHDRAKMRKRARRMAVQHAGLWIHENTIAKFAAREVDRAVRAERRAQRIATEEANKWREESLDRALRTVEERLNR